jgi:apolipoprotein N-acyltransferase
MESPSDEVGQARALGTLRTMTRELGQERVDLTVWPESAYPFRLARARKQEPLAAARAISAGSTPVLFGALTYAFQGAREHEYNSAWLVSSDGTLGARVDKKHLLPFAETIPLWHVLPFVRERYRSPGLSAGASGLLPFAKHKLGVLICYEDLIAGLSREHAQAGAEALVNLTNDGWFGRTSMPLLHEALARMRSIETRRDLLRATNTGRSTLISATGEVLEEAPPFVRTSFVAELRMLSSRTLYTRLGDWVSLLCLLACVALFFDARRFR